MNLGDPYTASVRKHLLPGSVTSGKLQSLLGPPFRKASKAAVRVRWESGCRPRAGPRTGSPS